MQNRAKQPECAHEGRLRQGQTVMQDLRHLQQPGSGPAPHVDLQMTDSGPQTSVRSRSCGLVSWPPLKTHIRPLMPMDILHACLRNVPLDGYKEVSSSLVVLGMSQDYYETCK